MITVLIFDESFITWASLVAQMVKNLPAMWETWVWSLGLEDPLEEGMATHSSILAWRIPMDRGAWWATVHGVTKSRTWLSDLCCYCVHHLEMWLLHGLDMTEQLWETEISHFLGVFKGMQNTISLKCLNAGHSKNRDGPDSFLGRRTWSVMFD